MNFNYDYQNKNKNNKIIYIVIIIVIAIIISSFMFRNSSNVIISTTANVITSPFVYIGKICNNISNLLNNSFSSKTEILEENENLKKEITQLKLDKIQTERVMKENEDLKVMLNIDKKYSHYELKHGNVVVKNFDNYTNTFIIDIGSKDGVKLYQPVIHENGLVGYISNVSETTSTVTTILDPKTSISVNISTINETAVLKGDINYKANNNLKLEYLPINAEISLGDVIYTSGLGDMYYSSIPVAKIVSVQHKKNESDRYAICEPVVNINGINQVAVIMK